MGRAQHRKAKTEKTVSLVRVKLSRSKGWRMPPNTRKVDRSTLHGNPFPAEKLGREIAVRLYREWITGATSDDDIRARFPPVLAHHLIAKRRWVLDSLPHIRGKNLACWCELPAVGEADHCHAAVLLELANTSEQSA